MPEATQASGHGDLGFQLRIPMRGRWDMKAMATSLMCWSCHGAWTRGNQRRCYEMLNDESQARVGLL